MKLYEIKRELDELLNGFIYENGVAINTATGEVLTREEMAKAIEKLELAKEEKLDNIAHFIKNLKAECVAIKSEEDALLKRRKAKENLQARLTEFLAYELDGQKRETPSYVVSFRASESVKIDDGASLPSEFLTMREPLPNKLELKKALKNGAIIDGVELVKNISCNVR